MAQKMPMRPTFPDAVLADTAALSHEEKGVLWDIENYMWLHGGWLLDDDKHLCKLIRLDSRRWKVIKPKLAPRFLYMEGKFTATTLHNDLEKARSRAEQNRLNGASGARKRRMFQDSGGANAVPRVSTGGLSTGFADLMRSACSDTVNRMAQHTKPDQ